MNVEPKSHDELRKMMYGSKKLRLRKITEKEFVQLSGAVLLVAILAIDGYINYIAVSAIWCVVLFLDQYLGLRYLRFLPQKETLQATLMNIIKCIGRRQTMSYVNNALIWATLAFVLGTGARGGIMNIFRWALMLLPVLAGVVLWISWTWSRRRNEVNDLLREMNDEASFPSE